uniref:Uncharacterized protein n=1 Tax=Sipha flava TaxID=143950 RepID=A0A2S2PXF0_9HEMI
MICACIRLVVKIVRSRVQIIYLFPNIQRKYCTFIRVAVVNCFIFIFLLFYASTAVILQSIFINIKVKHKRATRILNFFFPNNEYEYIHTRTRLQKNSHTHTNT